MFSEVDYSARMVDDEKLTPATAADVAREWPRWYEANRAVIGTNPSLIRPGELLVPP